jgi:hypothetical protein
MLNLPELSFGEVLIPWILIGGALGLLAAWLVVATWNVRVFLAMSGICHFFCRADYSF